MALKDNLGITKEKSIKVHPSLLKDKGKLNYLLKEIDT